MFCRTSNVYNYPRVEKAYDCETSNNMLLRPVLAIMDIYVIQTAHDCIVVDGNTEFLDDRNNWHNVKYLKCGQFLSHHDVYKSRIINIEKLTNRAVSMYKIIDSRHEYVIVNGFYIKERG